MSIYKNFACLLYVNATKYKSKDKTLKILMHFDFYKYLNIIKDKYIRYIKI